jgi:quercetin dioxygenase-like cupin family protein
MHRLSTSNEEAYVKHVDGYVVLGEGEGTIIQGPAGGPLTVKVRGAQTGGALTAFENVVAPGEGPPLHRHAREGESWFVIEGRFRFRLDDTVHDAPAGSYVFAAAGTPHCFQNICETPARLLVSFTPAGMETFFDRFAELPPGPIDPAVFAALGREAGMDVLGPPLAVSHPL